MGRKWKNKFNAVKADISEFEEIEGLDVQNAMMHCVWQCELALLTSIHGADEIGIAHEHTDEELEKLKEIDAEEHAKEVGDRARDQHNNRVGRGVAGDIESGGLSGVAPGTDSLCETGCKRALDRALWGEEAGDDVLQLERPN